MMTYGDPSDNGWKKDEMGNRLVKSGQDFNFDSGYMIT